jgi:hypothetical protein
MTCHVNATIDIAKPGILNPAVSRRQLLPFFQGKVPVGRKGFGHQGRQSEALEDCFGKGPIPNTLVSLRCSKTAFEKDSARRSPQPDELEYRFCCPRTLSFYYSRHCEARSVKEQQPVPPLRESNLTK